MTRNGVIISDNMNKMYVHKGVYFFFVGCISDIEAFIKCYFGEKPTSKVECSAIVFDNGKLFSVGIDDEEKEIFKSPMSFDIIESMGSGEQFAMAYMDLGSSAEGAVRLTMKRDCGTGGKVNVFKLKDHINITNTKGPKND